VVVRQILCRLQEALNVVAKIAGHLSQFRLSVSLPRLFGRPDGINRATEIP
jgi:hypothetical protein